MTAEWYNCFLLQKEIIDVLYDIFRLSIPKWSDSFAEAFLSMGKKLIILFINCWYLLR